MGKLSLLKLSKKKKILLGVFVHRGLNSGIWSPEVDASWVRRIHVACGWVMECSWVRVTQSCHFEHKLLYFFAAKIWCSLKVYWNGKRLSTLNIVLQEAVFRDVLFSSILLFTRFLFYLCVRAFCLAVCSSTPRGLHCDCWHWLCASSSPFSF